MASTYTHLGLELQATGENAGTWGTKTNTNLQIIEQISGGYTTQSIAIGTLNLLEAIRLTCQETKMYQASSSEMFGNNIDNDGFQRETTPMNPVSP